MYFIPFHITPKKKIKGWRRRDSKGNLIPYKVISMDIELLSNDVIQSEVPEEFIKADSINIIDEEDEEHILEKLEKEKTTEQRTIVWVLAANHTNNTFEWFNIQDVYYTPTQD